MPKSFFALDSRTVSTSGVTSVAFTNISQSYTNLILMYSARSNLSASSDVLNSTINSISSNYKWYTWETTGTTPTSNQNNSATTWQRSAITAANSTSNVFSNGNMVFSQYSTNSPKSGYFTSVASSNLLSWGSQINNTSAAISTLTLSLPSSTFVVGSTFYLYATL
jgi:hypothetical protein